MSCLSVCQHVSYPKLLNRFQLNLVLGSFSFSIIPNLHGNQTELNEFSHMRLILRKTLHMRLNIDLMKIYHFHLNHVFRCSEYVNKSKRRDVMTVQCNSSEISGLYFVCNK